MKPEANAVLLYAKQTLTTKPKLTQHKPAGVTVTPKAKPDDGAAEWRRFKSECVLLKGAKR